MEATDPENLSTTVTGSERRSEIQSPSPYAHCSTAEPLRCSSSHQPFPFPDATQRYHQRNSGSDLQRQNQRESSPEKEKGLDSCLHTERGWEDIAALSSV